jgi:hypothetical protein
MVKVHRRRWWWVVARGLRWRGPVEAGCGWGRESMVVIREWNGGAQRKRGSLSHLVSARGKKRFG